MFNDKDGFSTKSSAQDVFWVEFSGPNLFCTEPGLTHFVEEIQAHIFSAQCLHSGSSRQEAAGSSSSRQAKAGRRQAAGNHQQQQQASSRQAAGKQQASSSRQAEAGSRQASRQRQQASSSRQAAAAANQQQVPLEHHFEIFEPKNSKQPFKNDLSFGGFDSGCASEVCFRSMLRKTPPFAPWPLRHYISRSALKKERTNPYHSFEDYVDDAAVSDETGDILSSTSPMSSLIKALSTSSSWEWYGFVVYYILCRIWFCNNDTNRTHDRLSKEVFFQSHTLQWSIFKRNKALA